MAYPGQNPSNIEATLEKILRKHRRGTLLLTLLLTLFKPIWDLAIYRIIEQHSVFLASWLGING